jgi:acyl-CoA synthetase (NDP forming)
MGALPASSPADPPAERHDNNRPALRAMFSPRSIAVIGASTDRSSLSGRPLEILRQHGYPGSIYPVNPHHATVGGLDAYPAVGALPGPVDLAVVAVRAELVTGVLGECADAGVRSAVVFSSGFAEEGEAGAAAEKRIAALAAGSRMRVLGPNAEGFANLAEGIPVTFSPTVDRDRGVDALVPGNVAIVSQSGGLGFALFNWGQAAGLGASYVVSTGNEADLEALEVSAYLVEQPGTEVIALLVEGFRRPERLEPLARRAAELGKHLVVAKLGRSDIGARAALAHTAHDAGDDDAYREALERSGAVQVDDQEDLLDACFALSRKTLPSGPRVGIVTTSGGAGVWLADACRAAGLEVPELEGGLQDALRALMPSYGSARNPVDVTAQVLSRAGVAPALELVCRSERVDAVAVVSSLSGPQMLKREEAALRGVLDATRKPVVLYSYTKPGAESVQGLQRLGLAWYPSPVRTARALAVLARAAARAAGG